MRNKITIGTAIAVLGIWSQYAAADVIDLTGATNEGIINGALFQTGSVQPAGSGVLDVFVALQGQNNDSDDDADTSQGHNSGARPVLNEEDNPASQNRNLLLSEVPIVDVEGILWREFLLDINEPAAGTQEILNLNLVKIFQSDTADAQADNTGSNPLTNLGTMIYNMDAGGDNTVILSYNKNGGGSGQSDMFLYVLDSLFADLDYVYLWSEFGVPMLPPGRGGGSQPGAEEAGFEEWAVDASGDRLRVAEPGTVALLGIGLLGLGLARRRRKV